MTTADIEQRVTLVVKSISQAVRKAAPRVVNRAAFELASLSKAESKKNSHRIYQAIDIERALDGSWPARSRVFINTASPFGIRAAMTHNNTAGYHIVPKVPGIKFMWVPLTSTGRRHALHEHDAQTIGAKGWIGATETKKTHSRIRHFASGNGLAVGDWSDEERPLDYVLKRFVDIPPAKAPLFLTRVAMEKKDALVAYMQAELDTAIGGGLK